MREKNKELKAALLAEYQDQDGTSPYEITGIECEEPPSWAYLLFMIAAAVLAPFFALFGLIGAAFRK